MHKIFVIGAGTGSLNEMTPVARQKIDDASTVVVTSRLRHLAGETKNIIELRSFDETFSKISAALEGGDVAVIVSGDPGIFSLLPRLKEHFSEEIIQVIPGVSSISALCARAKTTWHDAVILSGHGREMSEAKILSALDQNAKVIFLCGPQWNPARLCELCRKIEGEISITVGERLGSPNERLTSGTPDELAACEYDSFAVVLVQNGTPWIKPQSRPRDEDFIRGDVPMTRETVRSAVLDTLRLNRDSVVWDLGAGTGSISVASALICEDGLVCAVDKNAGACDLIRRNMEKFHRHNFQIFACRALALLPSLPRPTHVFIGGGGAELPEILKFLPSLGCGIRVVVSAVSLGTSAIASGILSGGNFTDFDAVTVSVSRAKKVRGSYIMSAQNPVTIFSAVTKTAT